LKAIDHIKNGIENARDSDELGYFLDLYDDFCFLKRRGNVLEWGRYYFPDKFPLPFSDELHGYLIDSFTEAKTTTLAPRGHAKTTLRCVLAPLFYALNEPLLFRHYVNVQATTSKAVAVNISIRQELETNAQLIKDYGLQVTTTRWTQKQFVMANGVIFTAIGAGESMRGINYLNKRPDCVIIDDLYNDGDIENTENIAKKNAWFWSTLYKSTAIGKQTSIHVQGTAIHSTDLMHTLAKSSEWEFRKFVACDFATGSVLWPEANTIDKLQSDREAMGSIIFNREMLNDPRDETSSIIKSRWWQEVDELPPFKFVYKIGAIDPAEKTKDHNDYTAKVACYVTEDRDIYFVDIRNERLTFVQNKKDVVHFNATHNLDVVPFETNKAFGLYEELKRTTAVPVRERITDKDKITRLIAVSSFFENGKVYFVKDNIPTKVLAEARHQVLNNKPQHDDIRDAIVLAIEEIKQIRTAFIG
jgi:predicted phage terminase large subunit-like protein